MQAEKDKMVYFQVPWQMRIYTVVLYRHSFLHKTFSMTWFRSTCELENPQVSVRGWTLWVSSSGLYFPLFLLFLLGPGVSMVHVYLHVPIFLLSETCDQPQIVLSIYSCCTTCMLLLVTHVLPLWHTKLHVKSPVSVLGLFDSLPLQKGSYVCMCV